MRVPQVNERIKEAPAQALRGMFAGIGQLLLVTDKLRSKGQDEASVPASPDVPAPAAPAASTAPAAAEADGGTAEAANDLGKTGNGRLLPHDDAGPEGGEVPGAGVPAAEAPAAEAPAEVDAASDPANLPLPTYDDLSVASLRA